MNGHNSAANLIDMDSDAVVPHRLKDILAVVDSAMFRALLSFFLFVGGCILPVVSPETYPGKCWVKGCRPPVTNPDFSWCTENSTTGKEFCWESRSNCEEGNDSGGGCSGDWKPNVQIEYCTDDDCGHYKKEHSDRPFQLECTGKDACKDIDVKCPGDYDCVVNCVGKASCSGGFKFYGSERAHSLLSCDGEDACKAAKFKCRSDNFLCAVVDIGPQPVIDLQFEGCNDVKEGDATVYKIQYCGSDDRTDDRTAQTYGSDSLLKDYVCSNCTKCFRPPGDNPDNSCHSHEDNPQKCISPGIDHFHAKGYHVWCGAATPTAQAQTTTALAPTTTASTTTLAPTTTTSTPGCTWKIQFPENLDEPKSVFETGGSYVYVSAFITLLPPVYTCSRTLQFSCSSTNTNEVRVSKVFEIEERTPGPKSIASAGSPKKYNISLFGVKDYVNGDGENNVTINCSTNFHSFSTFSVKSVDVFLPNFDFAKRDGETLTLLYAGNKFTIVAPEALTGPTFLPHTEQHVYLGSYRLPNSSISIDEDGRRLIFDVPTQGLCTKLECDISIRVENQRPGRRKERLLRREVGDGEEDATYEEGDDDHSDRSGSSINETDSQEEDSQTNPSDPKPISFTRRAHYVKSPCHEDPVCEIPVANHHNYPSSRCPVGHMGSCKPCPVGARCPGGNIVWALPGFSTAIVEQLDGSMAEAIVPCPVPKERCLGYTKEHAAETCAVGYGGATCGGCTDGFFSKPVGPPTCFPCPKDVVTSSSIVAAILYLVVILFGVFMVVTIMSYIILKRNGGTFAGGMQRSKEFIIYVCISISLLSQASRVTLGKLPYYLNDLAYALAIFQMDVSGPVSPDCVNTEMFWRETLLFYISLFSVCFFSITINKRLRLKYCRGCRRSLDRTRHGVAFLLCFTYPLVTTFVIKMQNCIPAIDGSKAVVHVLSGNTLVKCYTGNHAHPYLLSSAVGIFHVIAFPVASTIVIIYVRRKYVTNWSSVEDNVFDGRPIWKFFLQNSYLPQKFWVRQLDLVIFFVCTVCNEIFARRNIHLYLGVYVVLLALSIVIYGTNKPFIKQESWKLPVRMYMFFCIFTYALTNYVSSDLIVDHEREDVQALFQWMCTVTMVFCLLLFLLLVVCFVKTLVDGAKAEEEGEVRKRSIVETTKENEESARGSVIEFFSNPISFVKTMVDGPKAEEEGEGRKCSIIDMTQANALSSPPAAPALEKKKAAKQKKKKRRARKPPPNTKVFGTWWELISENGKPYYYNQKEDRTQWERPQGWVKFMATERFNG